jgi:hypothetical protein
MKINEFPKPLFQKTAATALVGAGCFLVGGAYFFYAHDRIALALSAAVLLFSLVRAFGIYRTVSSGKYETVEGACVSVSWIPLKKYAKIKIKNDDGIETTLRLPKQTTIKIGRQYRFYFRES